MRQLLVTQVVFGSLLVASVASAQSQPAYGGAPAPAPTYTPAPVQPTPGTAAQYGQPAPAAQPQPQMQAQPQPQMQPQAQPQYAPAQPQPQPQYQPQYGQPTPQPAPQPGYGQPSYSGAPPPNMGPEVGAGEMAAAWRPSNTKFIIAGERLTGFSVLSGTLSGNGGPDVSGSVTSVNLLWANSSIRIADHQAINPYAMPMLTFHGVVGGGLTIGGGVGYASTAGSHDVPSSSGTTSADDPTRTAVAVAPRIGYLVTASQTFGIWLKGGVTYFSQKQESSASTDCSSGTCFTSSGSTTSISGVAFAIDPMLVFAPVPHVGILLGPVLDIGLSGTIEEGTSSTTSNDLKISNFGAAAGLALLI